MSVVTNDRGYDRRETVRNTVGRHENARMRHYIAFSIPDIVVTRREQVRQAYRDQTVQECVRTS